jgi:hypothetical protein
VVPMGLFLVVRERGGPWDGAEQLEVT